MKFSIFYGFFVHFIPNLEYFLSILPLAESDWFLKNNWKYCKYNNSDIKYLRTYIFKKHIPN